jgi:hypothetical protein
MNSKADYRQQRQSGGAQQTLHDKLPEFVDRVMSHPDAHSISRVPAI